MTTIKLKKEEPWTATPATSTSASIPESILLTAIHSAGGSTDDYASVRHILVENKLIEISTDHLATLTPAGITMADLVNKTLAKQKENPPCPR